MHIHRIGVLRRTLVKVSQVWDTKEHMEAFGQRLMPILKEVDIEPGQPEIVDVHNIIKG